ncbi:MAG: aromatic ring-hydroxylating dioxygenase subunit alpha [Cytophagales bacterium]|nr:aromatic ring-hydroxylating dioxygenase subunit alpha [Bernardetiaceae bacterium]MDW8211347.1 aromatic ring-hydroxylating dioxygenase subunit alpha [Cytophagales bacterium]
MGIFNIFSNIHRAQTLPKEFYTEPAYFEVSKERIFACSWQWVGDNSAVQFPQQVQPFTLLEGYLNEPLLLVRDENNLLHCLSNVCTHRGKILVEQPGKCRKIICGYHGRRFALNGQFEYMPDFKNVENFPSPEDNLAQVKLIQWHRFLFVSLAPQWDLLPVLAEIDRRISFLDFSRFRYDPLTSRDYLVRAHWALYCENYLEGFHIPFVHPDLNQFLDVATYSTEIYDFMNLQIGYANKGSDCFDLPKEHPDQGKEVAAYYFWIFPNLMLNFYPWGLSVNVVKPLQLNLCKVSFITYVYDPQRFTQTVAAQTDKVEREDEAVVESVQQGIYSRFYKAGRYSPRYETGVHHFHQLIARCMNNIQNIQ